VAQQALNDNDAMAHAVIPMPFRCLLDEVHEFLSPALSAIAHDWRVYSSSNSSARVCGTQIVTAAGLRCALPCAVLGVLYGV
ncbi:hypothetical protein SB773_33990, partial [Bacillus sp. SIMBA_074]